MEKMNQVCSFLQKNENLLKMLGVKIEDVKKACDNSELKKCFSENKKFIEIINEVANFSSEKLYSYFINNSQRLIELFSEIAQECKKNEQNKDILTYSLLAAAGLITIITAVLGARYCKKNQICCWRRRKNPVDEAQQQKLQQITQGGGNQNQNIRDVIKIIQKIQKSKNSNVEQQQNIKNPNLELNNLNVGNQQEEQKITN